MASMESDLILLACAMLGLELSEGWIPKEIRSDSTSRNIIFRSVSPFFADLGE